MSVFPQPCYGDALRPFVPEGYQFLGGEFRQPNCPEADILASIVRPAGPPIGAFVEWTPTEMIHSDGRKASRVGNFARDRARLINLIWPVEGYLE